MRRDDDCSRDIDGAIGFVETYGDVADFDDGLRWLPVDFRPPARQFDLDLPAPGAAGDAEPDR